MRQNITSLTIKSKFTINFTKEVTLEIVSLLNLPLKLTDICSKAVTIEIYASSKNQHLQSFQPTYSCMDLLFFSFFNSGKSVPIFSDKYPHLTVEKLKNM